MLLLLTSYLFGRFFVLGVSPSDSITGFESAFSGDGRGGKKFDLTPQQPPQAPSPIQPQIFARDVLFVTIDGIREATASLKQPPAPLPDVGVSSWLL